MQHRREEKIATISIFLSITAAIFLFESRVGPFVPVISAFVDELTQAGRISSHTQGTVAGFYLFGSFTQQLIGVTGIELIHLPITLFSVTILFFALAKNLSSSLGFASIVTVLYVTSGTTGGKILFQVHGFGTSLFLTSVLLLLFALQSSQSVPSGDLNSITSVLIVVGIALVFSSYNLTYWLLLMLAGVGIALMVTQLQDEVQFDSLGAPQLGIHLFVTLTVISVCLLWLSDFVFEVFLPTVLGSLLSGAGGANNIDPQFAYLVFETPVSITITGAIRYLTLGLSGLLMTAITIYRIRQDNSLSAEEMLLYPLAFVAVLYATTRAVLGHNALTAFFYPGIFAFLLLYNAIDELERFKRYKRPICATFLVVLFLTNGIVFALYDDAGLSPEEKGNQEVAAFATWEADYNDGRVETDIRTRSLSVAYLTSQSSGVDSTVAGLFYGEYSTVSLRQADALIKGRQPPGSEGDIYVVNTEYDTIALVDWGRMKAWYLYTPQINENRNAIKVYSGGDVIVYVPT